ncbi:MAG: hypothetical protein ABSE74_06800 [Methanoregula sp.]|jgi:hypothetical protein
METYRFGKHPPKNDFRTLRFKKYLMSNIAPPPTSDNKLATVFAKLKMNTPTKLFPMDGNDKYGDCTIAALAHAETVFRGLVGKKLIMPSPAAVKLYFQLTEGVDSGMNELDVLNYWQSNRVSGDELVAFAKLDQKNHEEIEQALHLFGGVYLGFQCQENCQQEFQSHKPWTPGPLTNDGHAVFAVAYDQNGVTVLTWGNTQIGTWDWWDECVDEAYALLPPEAQEPGFAPGFDFAQLKADLNAVAQDSVPKSIAKD